MTTQREHTVQGAIVIPEAAASRDHHGIAEIDHAVDIVAANARRWTRTPIADRRRLLARIIDDTMSVAEAWSVAGAEAKGIEPGTPAWGEDVATGPMQLVRHARLLDRTLESLEQTGEVGLPGPPVVRPDGQVTVPVFPTSLLERATYVGHTADVWLQRSVTSPEQVRTALAYRSWSDPKVAFVLGAGNVSSVGASDCLYKLYNEDQVCVLKMNPVNEHTGQFVEVAIRALVEEGFVRIIYGGAKEGEHLTSHPKVDTIHMTASDKTHDAVVFGTGEAGARRKAERTPLIDKEVTSELGNVSPVIVVPGPWSDDDIAYQGKSIASMLAANAGFTCACPRVIVTHGRWNRRRAFLDAFRRALAESPQRAAYYPGARDRWRFFCDAYPDAEVYGRSNGDPVPWTLLPDLDPTDADQPAFNVEAFNGVLGEVALEAPLDVGAYLDAAVDFCNDTLWGTLGVTLIVHPKTLQSPGIAAAFDRAIANLRYGTVSVNAWAATGYGLTSTPWGAFPGHPLHDIQSGRGVVHNTYMLEDVEKAVIRAPFKLGKKPPMSYDFSTFGEMSRRLLRAEAYGDWKQLPGIVRDGIKA
ncbi:aldehyde dehydrogenase family protein [Nitriliruptor alkaliphilus]|uniref:aldehyde dehydrogenase family protein n=1 Tax=Nitriliruptor alkaliphilus TaxID=427918 RepID=UPI000696DA90|nr:aldehyde dehydrogenase family protein [Nitriliruptor alkaliphilus]